MVVRIFLSLLFTFIYLNAEFNLTKLDQYHENICHALIDGSNRLDSYLMDINSTESTTEAEIKTSYAIENGRESEYTMRLRLRLSLPYLQNKFRIVLEDEDSNDPLYDGTNLDNEYKAENKNYFLGVQYFDYMIQRHHVSSALGVRFRKSTIQPYVNFKVEYLIEENEEYTSQVTDRLRLYSNGDIENIFTYNILEPFQDEFYVLIDNVHRYQNWEEDRTISNSIAVMKLLDDQRVASLGVGLLSRYNRDEIKIVYPQLYGVYHAPLYKDWIYYELSPSLLWREENNYAPSARFMVNIGTLFKTY